MYISSSDVIREMQNIFNNISSVTSLNNKVSFSLQKHKSMELLGPYSDVDVIFKILGTSGHLRYIARVSENQNGNLHIDANIIQSLQYMGGCNGLYAKQLNSMLPDMGGRCFIENGGIIVYQHSSILSEHRRYNISDFLIDMSANLQDHLTYSCWPTKITPQIDIRMSWPLVIKMDVPLQDLGKEVRN